MLVLLPLSDWLDAQYTQLPPGNLTPIQEPKNLGNQTSPFYRQKKIGKLDWCRILQMNLRGCSADVLAGGGKGVWTMGAGMDSLCSRSSYVSVFWSTSNSQAASVNTGPQRVIRDNVHCWVPGPLFHENRWSQGHPAILDPPTSAHLIYLAYLMALCCLSACSKRLFGQLVVISFWFGFLCSFDQAMAASQALVWWRAQLWRGHGWKWMRRTRRQRGMRKAWVKMEEGKKTWGLGSSPLHFWQFNLWFGLLAEKMGTAL